MPRPKNPTPPKSRSNRPPSLKTRGVYADVKLNLVPFDSSVDCPPYACFNCRVLDDHLSKDCKKPMRYEYCINCGRRGVKVRDCPRCGEGFCAVFGPKSAKYVEAEPPMIEVDKNPGRKLPVGMTPPPKPTKKKQRTKSSNSLSSVMSPEKVPVMEIVKSHSVSNSAVGSEIEEELFIVDVEDEEDLEQMIFDEDLDDLVFDENEIPEEESLTSSAVQSFANLIDLMKHLPIETQNKVVTQFVEYQKFFSD